MSTGLLSRPSRAAPPEPHDGLAVSEADYWAYYYEGWDVTYEWNDGVLEEKGVSTYETFLLYDWFVRLLTEFLDTEPIADRVGLEMGFRLALPGKVTIRRPDYGVVRHDNPVPLTGAARSYRGLFDLCIEGVSTSSRVMRERDTVVKKTEYAAAGVREYYLLHPSPRLRQFYQLNAQGVYEPLPVGPEGVVRSTVLPGFQWRLADLERRPPLERLSGDPVYRGYVWLKYQQQQALTEQERQRAEQERQRAEQERQRAEQERQRAERLHARLRALGVDPDALP
jgi:hypothetical protein